MKTDYNNLKLTDTLAVFIAAVGIVIVGVLGFQSLPSEHQTRVAHAVEILDMQEQIDQQAQALAFLLFEAPDDFFKEFYVAFGQVASIPYETIVTWQETGKQIQTAIYDLSDTVGVAYQKNFIDSSRQAMAMSKSQPGIVLGISDIREYGSREPDTTILENLVPGDLTEPRIEITKDPRTRGYRAPDLKKFFEKLKLMEE